MLWLWLYPNQQRRRSAYGANWSHDGFGMRASWSENDYINHLILLDFTPSDRETERPI